MTLQKIWNDYKKLPLWKQILLSLPLVLVIVLLFFVGGKDKTNPELVKRSKETVDSMVSKGEASIQNQLNEVKKLEKERQRLINERKKYLKEYSDLDVRINNASSSDDLRKLAAELRERRRNR